MEAQATANTQIATAQERVRGLEAERAGLLAELQHLRTQADSWREALDAARDERAQLAERAARVPGLEAQCHEQAALTQAARQQVADLQSQLAAQAMQLDAERRAAQEKLQLLNEAREALTHQFKSLANDILEEKASASPSRTSRAWANCSTRCACACRSSRARSSSSTTPRASSARP
jgi:DNA recombination protein RmuC